MNEQPKMSQVDEPEMVTQFVDLSTFEFVEVSHLLWKEHLEYRSARERRHCLHLLVAEFVEKHGFYSPAMGKFHAKLLHTGRFAFYGVLYEDYETGDNLDFYLAAEVE